MWIWQISSSGAHLHQLGIRTSSIVTLNLGVTPMAFGHQVNVVWTADAWQTVCWSSARFKTIQNSSEEIWEAQLTVGSNAIRPGADPIIKFWYAFSITNGNGYTVWNNNRGWNFEHMISGSSGIVLQAAC